MESIERRVETYEGDTEELKTDIEGCINHYSKRRKLYNRLNVGLVLGGILLSFLIAVLGIIDLAVTPKSPTDPNIASDLTKSTIFTIATAILGALITAALTIDRALGVGAKATYYSRVVVQFQNLLSELKFGEITQEKLRRVFRRFLIIRESAQTEKPTGEGIGAVEKLYESLGKLEAKDTRRPS
jgi:hypothetical protein